MDAIISHGCFLGECSVEHSIVGIRSRLDNGVDLKVKYIRFIFAPISLDAKEIVFFSLLNETMNSVLQDTMMMGADYYQTESEISSTLAQGKVPVGVGHNTKIRYLTIS